MPSFTPHYNLRKDAGTDRYSVSTANGNSDIIDSKIYEIDFAVKSLISGFKFKGNCDFDELPTSESEPKPQVNDTWYVIDKHCLYTYDGTQFLQSGAPIIVDDETHPTWGEGKAAEASNTKSELTQLSTRLNTSIIKATIDDDETLTIYFNPAAAQ